MIILLFINELFKHKKLMKFTNQIQINYLQQKHKITSLAKKSDPNI